ncbi:hypothetical protein CEQ90_04330 [Lewinellaceae bacterium SD302]|nr:hypothetical protein CEQ90_04330 [Lewinellaceae bacterium SD302]
MRFFATLLILTSFTVYGALNAQPAFTNATSQLFYQNTSSGAPIGCADMNGDGLDDIVHIYRPTDMVRIQYQQPGQNFVGLEVMGSTSNPWSLALADVNADGLNDIFLGPVANPEVLISTGVPGAYLKTTLSQSVFSQGANFSDIDVDGDLDLFVCHDVGLSTPYRNDGSGNFTYDLSLIAAYTNGDSDNSGNYATIWTDYDNDGDQDMYLSRCRQGAGNPLDPRRINQLFQNDGNGNFTDVAEAAGLMPLAQSWATDFADLDNDGDLDCVILNHDQTSRIYEQTSPGLFTDRTIEVGLNVNPFTPGIQVIIEDFDNDGWQDLVLTGTSGDLFMQNQGDFTFTFHHNDISGGAEPIHTAAVGDLNNDGRLDLIAGRGSGFNGTSSSNPDVLLLNDNINENNFLKIRLEGEHSNRNGVGSRLEVYGDWGVQVREVRAGESYGISHSLTKHFGLGEATEIDSLAVRWPDGDRYVFQGLSVNTTYLIPERPQEIILTSIEAMICEGDTLFAFGQVFTEAGIYQNLPELIEIDTLALVSLHLGLYESSATLLATQICQGEDYLAQDGTVYSLAIEDFTHQSVLTNQNGCDSIIEETITVFPLLNDTMYVDLCPGQGYQTQDGSEILNVQESFVYESLLTDQNGCDRIITEQVTVSPVYQFTLESNICSGEDFMAIDGTLYGQLTESFEHLNVLTTMNGCDSLIEEVVTVQPTFVDTLEVSICQGENYVAQDGTEFPNSTESFTYQSVLTGQNDCDSIVEETVTVLPTFSSELEASICSAQGYVAQDGTEFPAPEESFVYQSILTAQNGCDSVITESVEVVTFYESTEFDTICWKSDYVAPDGTVFEMVHAPFQYISYVVDTNGCFTVITSEVSLYPGPVVGHVLEFACPFTTLVFNDSTSVFVEDRDTTIHVDVLDQNGCLGSLNYDIIVTPFEFIIDETPTSLLYSGVNEVVQWVDCDAGFAPIEGATDFEFFPAANGNYAVILSRGECIDTSDCINFIITSTEEPNWAGGLKIYPNPTNGLLYVEQPASGLETNFSLRVTDLLGREVPVAITTTANQRQRIELPPAAGVYLLKITDDRGRSTVRRIVVR